MNVINSIQLKQASLMTSVYEWHCSHACTLVMERTLDLPSVIELAPCKYKRVYFYFGTTKCIIFELKIILIYLTSIINFNYSIPFSICHNTIEFPGNDRAIFRVGVFHSLAFHCKTLNIP
jgi:hypothetical protein